jgi:hypothetical protein
MKTSILLLTASLGGLLLAGCEYDEGYHHRTVTVTREGYYPSGDYDEYSPYYSYQDRRYYRTGRRYVYYTDSRPYYVTTLPSGARYITPARRGGVVVRSDRANRNSPDWPR